MSRPPMLFTISKWDSDTKNLTDDEELAYFRLTKYARESAADWSSCPVDPRRLAVIVRFSLRRWAKVAPAVLSYWKLSADGTRYEHEYLQKLAEKDKKWVEQRSKAGTASASSPKHRTPVRTTVPTKDERPFDSEGALSTNERSSAVSRAAFASALEPENPPPAASAASTPVNGSAPRPANSGGTAAGGASLRAGEEAPHPCHAVPRLVALTPERASAEAYRQREQLERLFPTPNDPPQEQDEKP